MSRRFSNFVVLFVLGIAIALLPVACGSDNPTDGGSDHVTGMTNAG